jgi:hypothetical protein
VVGGGCGPAVASGSWATQTVTVTEMVPTNVQETRTVMRAVTKAEAYTAYRTEVVPTTSTMNVTVNKLVTETVMTTQQVSRPVTETVMETRTISKRVPVTKTVMVNETQYQTVQETTMVSKTVRNTVKVPTTVDLGPSILDRFKGFANPCYCPCPRTVTVCKRQTTCETVCEPVTTCRKVAVTVCVPKTVTTCETVCETVQVPCTRTRMVCETVQVPTTVTKCVPTVEARTVTTNVCKQVPYTCTRNVTVCEPVTETVTVCKMVPTQVQKQVQVWVAAPAAAVATGGCGDPCATGVASFGDAGVAGGRAGILDRLRGRIGGLFNRGCDPCGSSLFGGWTPGSRLGGLFHRDRGCAVAAPSCGAAAVTSCGGCGH